MQTKDDQMEYQYSYKEEKNPGNEIPSEESPKPKKGKNGFLKELFSWIFTLGMAVVIAFAIRTLLFEPVRVDGSSMCDTLVDGEIMLVTKPEYLFGDPKIGDVVICHYPERGNTNFVKRVIGVPGDTIEIQNNVVIRNGEPTDEPYLTPSRNDDGFSMDPFTLGEEEYFVAGDNRDNSHDSRNYYSSWGGSIPSAITRDMIKGHVQLVVYPLEQFRAVD